MPPPRTPTAILRARGSGKAKHRRDDLVFAGDPVPPPWLDLDEQERAIWDNLVPMLSPYHGVLASFDAGALGRYCGMVKRWLECRAWIRKNGHTYPVKNAAGEVTGVAEFPAVARECSLADRLLALEIQFGLTPAARARLNIDLIDVAQGVNEFFPGESPRQPVKLQPPVVVESVTISSSVPASGPTMPQDAA